MTLRSSRIATTARKNRVERLSLSLLPAVLFLTLFFAATMIPTTSAQDSARITFTDVTKEAGITFVNSAAKEKKYIVESMGGGVAFFDFDRDGRLDIYLVNSYTVEASLARAMRPKAGLYRNLGNGKFEDVAAKAGVDDPGWAMGVSIADFDSDGFDDLYVTCFGPNKLYRNRGDGRFEDVTTKAGVGDPRFSSGAAWADYDRDGDLDLFVANYVDFKLDDLPQFGKGQLCQYRGVPVQCGPRGLPGAGDALYRNNGNGTFTEVSKAAGLDDQQGYYGLGAMWTDFDDDGWLDLLVANDATPNYAYRNRRDGTFEEVGLSLGWAVDENANEQGSMGITVGDYDRDQRLDVVVTNFADQYNTFYHKNEDGSYTDVSRATGTADVSMPYVGWGTKLFDYDNDGWLDLLVVNGHVYPQLEGAFPGAMYKQRKLFFQNLRNGTFKEIAAELGPAMMERRSSRGAAFGDYDEDGDIDVIINDLDGPPMLLRNDGGNRRGHWVKVDLASNSSNRRAVGARVTLKAGGMTQIDEVHAGDSYISHSDWRLHFGIGAAKTVDEISVRWSNGKTSRIEKVAVDRVVKISEEK